MTTSGRMSGESDSKEVLEMKVKQLEEELERKNKRINSMRETIKCLTDEDNEKLSREQEQMGKFVADLLVAEKEKRIQEDRVRELGDELRLCKYHIEGLEREKEEIGAQLDELKSESRAEVERLRVENEKLKRNVGVKEEEVQRLMERCKDLEAKEGEFIVAFGEVKAKFDEFKKAEKEQLHASAEVSRSLEKMGDAFGDKQPPSSTPNPPPPKMIGSKSEIAAGAISRKELKKQKATTDSTISSGDGDKRVVEGVAHAELAAVSAGERKERQSVDEAVDQEIANLLNPELLEMRRIRCVETANLSTCTLKESIASPPPGFIHVDLSSLCPSQIIHLQEPGSLGETSPAQVGSVKTDVVMEEDEQNSDILDWESYSDSDISSEAFELEDKDTDWEPDEDEFGSEIDDSDAPEMDYVDEDNTKKPQANLGRPDLIGEFKRKREENEEKMAQQKRKRPSSAVGTPTTIESADVLVNERTKKHRPSGPESSRVSAFTTVCDPPSDKEPDGVSGPKWIEERGRKFWKIPKEIPPLIPVSERHDMNCHYCGKMFGSVSSRSRSRHKNMHLFEYKCGVCEAKFKWPGSFYIHFDIKHNGKKIKERIRQGKGRSQENPLERRRGRPPGNHNKCTLKF